MTNKVGLLVMVLIASTLVFGLVGAVLVKSLTLRFKSGPRYAQVCATVVMAGAWVAVQSPRFQIELDAVSLGAALVSVWVLGYIVVWAIVGYTLTTVAHLGSDSDSSIMTAMFPATQQHEPDFQATQQFSRDDARDKAHRK